MKHTNHVNAFKGNEVAVQEYEAITDVLEMIYKNTMHTHELKMRLQKRDWLIRMA